MSEITTDETVEQILIKIDQLIENASTVPFSGKKMVDSDQLHELVDEIRISLPGEIKRARDLNRDKINIMAEAKAEADKIVADAKKEAQGIIADAQTEADRLVSEQEIIGRANQYAKEQVQQANEQAAGIVEDARAKDKAIREAMVANLNANLSDAISVLEKNLKAVTNTKDAIAKLAE